MAQRAAIKDLGTTLWGLEERISMLRVVVLIAVFVFFREVRPRRSTCSFGAITPYRSSIDRMFLD
jgi:hypothetical protein